LRLMVHIWHAFRSNQRDGRLAAELEE
jgi:hypothetical protein